MSDAWRRLEGDAAPYTRAPGVNDAGPTWRGPVTVLFSDLCGYTALAEQLDPEELHGIMAQLFAAIAEIVERYEGRVDKLLGDAALALFGTPLAHEDDAVRAIKAAMEIHNIVEQMGDDLMATTGRPLRMHSALASGVLVTTETDAPPGASALGSAINMASRLLNEAGPGEIVCAESTFGQAQGYFDFDDLGLRAVRGHDGEVRVHRVVSTRALPLTEHRVGGVRARLVGRTEELAELVDYVSAAERGTSGVVTICGEAGTGKSRLVDELRDRVALDRVRWLETSARAYAHNIPYHPFRELLAREWDIQDGDSASVVQDKVECAATAIRGGPADAALCADVLFGLQQTGDPESWRRHFYALIRALVDSAPEGVATVFYVGDLHWADPSTLELLRYLVESCSSPILHIFTYRPSIDPLGTIMPAGVKRKEIRLEDLSSSEGTEMIASLLEADEIPASLRLFLQHKSEGNPFYLEELVNSLIETGSLIRHSNGWQVVDDLSSVEVPLSVLGMVSARLDRLNTQTHRVLLEASVLGRRILPELLGRITDDPEFGRRLEELQRLGLIRVRSLQPLEYEFKHAMIQDAAYAGLLRAERRELHRRVGAAFEEMFADRLPELCETLAIHNRLGGESEKAVDYLTRAAEKCFRRHAVQESYEFYRQAYEALTSLARSPERDRQLLALVNAWGYVVYDQGNMKELEALLATHEDLAESLGVTSEHAMYHVIYGIALHCRERFRDALSHERRGLEIALAVNDEHAEACGRVWLANTLAEMGQLDESMMHAEKAIPVLGADPIWITEAHCALGFGHWTRGDAAATFAVAEDLLELARSSPSVRALAAGLWVKGEACLADGDYESAAGFFRESIDAAPEPWPSTHPRVYLGIAYLQLGRYEEAKPYLCQVIELSRERGSELTLTPSSALLGLALCASGDLTEGMRRIEESRSWWSEHEAVLRLGTMEVILGNVFLGLTESKEHVRLSTIVHNAGFLARNLPRAPRLAEQHFTEAIRIWEGIGAVGSAGEAYLGLGRLYRAHGARSEAERCTLEAINCFEQAGIRTQLRSAREMLASMS